MNWLNRKTCEADKLMQRPSLNKTTEVVALRVTANRSGALRVWLVLAMIVSYLAMMAFLTHSARHAMQTVVVAVEFSPATTDVVLKPKFHVVGKWTESTL